MSISNVACKLILFVSVVITNAACSLQEPVIQIDPDAQKIGDNLYKVENAWADTVYLNPDVDYSRYKKILVKPLVLDDVQIIQPVWVPPSKKWTLTDADKEKLTSLYLESMTSQLPKGGAYELAAEPGEDVLILEARLIAIAPTAPKDDARNRPIGRSQIITEGGGVLTLAASLNNSQTGVPLIQFVDKRAGSTMAGRNIRISNLAEIKKIFNYWAAATRNGLGQADSLKRQ